MLVYIDAQYRCHAAPGEGLREVETAFFDGKCRRFLEGYRFVPAGESWTREDGEVFAGGMAAPFEDYSILAAAQAQYEEGLPTLQDRTAALALLGVEQRQKGGAMPFLEKARQRRRELDAIEQARDDYAGRLRDVAEAMEAMHESPSFTQLLDFLDELRELMEVSL